MNTSYFGFLFLTEMGIMTDEDSLMNRGQTFYKLMCAFTATIPAGEKRSGTGRLVRGYYIAPNAVSTVL